MELTNFIWHLGAALAALWAGLAYRSLKLKLIELEQGVLASLLERTDEGSASNTPARMRRRASVRARALRWFSAKLERKHGTQIEFSNRQVLYELGQSDWNLAVHLLSDLLNDEAFFRNRAGHACQLIWFSEGTTGRWVLEEWSGGKHA